MATVSRDKLFRLEAIKQAPGADGTAAGPTRYKFRANDGEWDRYQDRLSVKGWQLDAFKANPVLLFNHNASALPIGKAHVYVEGDALMAEVEFDQDDEFARKVEQKVAKGILSAVSVRYLMHKYHQNERGGFDSDEHELLELSVVTIPGNQRATRAKGLDDVQDVVDAFTKAFTKSLGAQGASTTHTERAAMDEQQIKAMQERLAALEAEKKAADEAKALEARKAADEAHAQRIADMAQAKILDAAKGNRDGFAPMLQKTADVSVGKSAAEGTGINFARFVKAQAAAKMMGRNPADVAKGWGYNDVAKALSESVFEDGGSLVRPEYAAEFIELLRNKTVIRKAGARTVPMGSSLTFDGQASAASASYGGSTENIAPSSPKTSQPLVLSERKLRALVPVPNDLIRNASRSAEEFVRDDLLRVMALKEDEKFLYGAGTVFEPRGLQSQLVASHKFAMTALTAAGKPTIEEMKRQLNKVLKTIEKANLDVVNGAWFVSPSIKNAVLDAVGPGGEGSNALEREYNERGTWRGFPVLTTNQIAETSTADLFFFAMEHVIIGESMAMALETFPNGTYHDGSSVVSGISTDQTVIRAITKHDIGLRYNTAGVNVTGMTWGI